MTVHEMYKLIESLVDKGIGASELQIKTEYDTVEIQKLVVEMHSDKDFNNGVVLIIPEESLQRNEY